MRLFCQTYQEPKSKTLMKKNSSDVQKISNRLNRCFVNRAWKLPLRLLHVASSFSVRRLTLRCFNREKQARFAMDLGVLNRCSGLQPNPADTSTACNMANVEFRNDCIFYRFSAYVCAWNKALGRHRMRCIRRQLQFQNPSVGRLTINLLMI